MIIKQIKWEREFFHISSFNIHWIWVATGAFEKLIETTSLTETHRERESVSESLLVVMFISITTCWLFTWPTIKLARFVWFSNCWSETKIRKIFVVIGNTLSNRDPNRDRTIRRHNNKEVFVDIHLLGIVYNCMCALWAFSLFVCLVLRFHYLLFQFFSKKILVTSQANSEKNMFTQCFFFNVASH